MGLGGVDIMKVDRKRRLRVEGNADILIFGRGHAVLGVVPREILRSPQTTTHAVARTRTVVRIDDEMMRSRAHPILTPVVEHRLVISRHGREIGVRFWPGFSRYCASGLS
jgi:hypothetical protein